MTDPAGKHGSAVDEPARFAKTKERLDQAKERAAQLRQQVEKVPAGAETLDAIDHDRRIGGNLLAGALAYRVFVWLLPMALVAVSLLGFLRSARSGAPADYAHDLGVSAYVTSTVADAAQQAERSRWVALIIGLIALVSTGYTLAKAVRAVHALAWVVPIGRLRSAPKAVGSIVGIGTVVVVISDLVRSADDVSRRVGLVVTLASVVAYAGLMLLVSLAMPHRDARWWELLPGPILLAVGAVGLQVLTSYYVVPKLQTASQAYGALGGAAAVLLWLYLISRLVVASAVVNANHWGRRHKVDLAAERPGLISRQL